MVKSCSLYLPTLVSSASGYVLKLVPVYSVFASTFCTLTVLNLTSRLGSCQELV